MKALRALALSAAALGLAACAAPRIAGAPTAIPAGAVTLDGEPISFDPANADRPTLLVFWASWCEACGRETAEIVKLHSRMGERLTIIGINVDVERDAAIAYAREHALGYPSVWDPQLKLADAMQVSGTPMLLLFAAGGRLAASGHSLAEVEGAIAQLVEAPQGTQADPRPAPPPVRASELVQPAMDGEATPVIERSAALMGTSIEILVVSADAPAANRAIDAALAEMERVERLISSWQPTSQISALNRAAGAAPVPLDKEVLDLLADAVSLCTLTERKFDVTFKGAGRLWSFQGDAPRPPDPEAVKQAIGRIDCRALQLDHEAGTAFLPRAGMAVGLGGIGKGYAVDRAAAVLRERGFKDFVVNAGGDLFGSGRHDGQLWRVLIRDPRERGAQLAVLPLSNLAVATSGDYERFFIHDGVRYHHILDPATGYPARGCRSVTVLAPAAYLADALATGVFVLGPERGLALIERLEDVEGAIVDEAGEIHISSGLSRPDP